VSPVNPAALPRLNLFADRRFEPIAGYFQLVIHLHVHPELRRVAKIMAKAQGGFPGNAARAVDNRADAIGGHMERFRELVHGEAIIGHEFFLQVFSGMNWRQFLGHESSSVVVHDFDIAGVSFAPSEQQPPRG
jgi:hypothetical protein